MTRATSGPIALATVSAISGTTEGVPASGGSGVGANRGVEISPGLLESALAVTERASTEAEHRAHALLSATKELQKAAARGDLAKLHRALDGMRDSIAGADEAVAAAPPPGR
jgi:hypothetical protein